MSAFDLDKITESLRSLKIKNRNDALNLLAGLSASKLKLSARQLIVLTSGLLQLIEIEKAVYANNSSNPVVSRLSIALTFLRDLVEEELKNHRKLRYKHWISIVNTITTNYFADRLNSSLEPCIVPFSQILRSVISENLVRTHLTVEAWQKVYKFIQKAIDVALDESRSTPSSNETLLCNMVETLLLLIGGDTSLTYLPLYQDQAYFSLLRLCKRCLKSCERRESPVLIACFKLINKLVPALATEDVKFCHELVKYALKSIIQFASTSVEPLFIQFCIFLNLDSVHRFFRILHLPLLTSVEITSETTLSIGDSSRVGEDELEVQLYTVGMLIQALLSRLIAASQSIGPENVIIHRSTHLDWFRLTNVSYTSSNGGNWLLLTGLAKLVDSYFRLRAELSDKFIERSLQSSKNFTSSTIDAYTNKRQKMKDAKTKLWAAETALQLYMSLASNIEEPKARLCGLQLLTVHFELFENLTESKAVVKTANTDSSTSWNLNESTIMDLDTFTSTDGKLVPCLRLLVRLINESSNVFWALVCAHSLLDRILLEVGKERKALTKLLHQLLKLLLTRIKERTYSTVATSIISQIILLQLDANVEILVDESLKSQLLNIIEMADLAGPAIIDNSTLHFWFCVPRMLRGVINEETIALSVDRWFISRFCDTSQEHGPQNSLSKPGSSPNPIAIGMMLLWISGKDANLSDISNIPTPCSVEFEQYQIRSRSDSKLQGLIALERDKSSDKVTHISCPLLLASTSAFNSIKQRIKETHTNIMRSEIALEKLTEWAILLTNIVDTASLDTLQEISDLLTCCKEAWSMVADEIQSSKQSFMVIDMVLESSILSKTMKRISLPVSKILSHIPVLQKCIPAPIIEAEYDDFGSSSQILESRQSFAKSLSPDPQPSNSSSLFEFKFMYGDNSFQEHMRQLELLDSHSLLKVLSSYVKHLKATDMIEKESLSLFRLVRLIGEGPLSDQRFDRDDLTVKVSCEILGELMPICGNRNDDLTADLLDLFKYLAQCVLKGLFLTNSKVCSFWNLYFSISVSLGAFEMLSLLMAAFLEDFETSSNCFKVNLSNSLAKHLSVLDGPEQMDVYRELFLRFANPQASIERCAAYCSFFREITHNSELLKTTALFNFIECAKHPFLKPYLRSTIAGMSNNRNSKVLFVTNKFELLRNWTRYNHNVFEYPYDLFDYSDLSSFLSENYKEIISILISMKSESRTPLMAELTKIAKVKGSDVESLICDSLSLIVPMAYTTEGIRNSIFKVLTELLQENFKLHTRQKLNLIILEILRFTDYSDESTFANLLSRTINGHCFGSISNVSPTLQTSVSPNSSFELINVLVLKYWKLEGAPYWSHERCYFFIRQLGRRSSRLRYGETAFLRMIKYVLSLSNLPLTDAKVFELVVDSCSCHDWSFKYSEMYSILSLFDVPYILTETGLELMRTTLKILNLACLSHGSSKSLSLIRQLESASSNLTNFPSYSRLVSATLALCESRAVMISYSDFEDFLNDPRAMLLIEHNLDLVLLLFSHLLKFASKSEIRGSNQQLVAIFLKNSLTTANDEITMWISLYLSQFYLSGSFEKVEDAFTEQKESIMFTNEDYSQNSRGMNFFLGYLLRDLESPEYERAAFVETILGSISWKYEANHNEVQKFMNYEDTYAKVKKFLIPMDFHSCILINSPESEFKMTCVSLESYIRDFSSFILNSTSDQWMSQLLLSVIQEIAAYTSLASLLVSYVLQFPESAGELLPNLLCFYTTLTGKEGAKKVGNLLSSYWKLFKKPYDQRAIEMIKNTVLLVRAGAKLDILVFKTLYEGLNKMDLSKIVQKGTFPKSALMLLEDAQSQTLNQTSLNQQLALIYESLDEDDLFHGLPEDPSVDNALKLLSRLGTSAEKVNYRNGQLDAFVLLNSKSNGHQLASSLVEDGQLGLSKALDQNLQRESSSFEWAWKLNLWSIPVSREGVEKHSVVYAYFRQIQESLESPEDIYKHTILNLMGSKHSSTVQAKQYLETISILETLQSIIRCEMSDLKSETGKFDDLTLWFSKSDPNYSEDLLRARQIAYKLRGDKMQKNPFLSFASDSKSPLALKDLTLQGLASSVGRAIDIHRINKQEQKMISSTILLDEIMKSSDFHEKHIQDELLRLSKFHFAKTFWDNGKTSTSVAFLRDVIEGGSIELPFDNLCVHSTLASATLAKWLVESRQSLGSTVFAQIIEPIRSQLEEIKSTKQKAQVLHLLAHFCEQQYKSKTLTDQLGEIAKRVHDNRKEIEEIKTHYSRTSVLSAEKKSVQKYYNRLKSRAAAEESELANLNSKRELFARNAATFYLSSLLVGDEYSSDMDNLFSLFLELAGDVELQTDLADQLQLLPTFKPLSWCTQLLSRISNDDSHFQRSVQTLIFRICKDHPFHLLYYLISLIKHEEFSKETSNLMMSVRVEAAKQLREKLLSDDLVYATDVLLPVERLSDQCILLSEYKGSKGKKLDLEKLKIGQYWMNDLLHVPPPTLDLPVSHNGYDQAPYMVGVSPKVSIATSGLSLPKIATLNLSDGTLHKMLLKHGTDDLRQDATMEQVFNKVNYIFNLDKEARKRNLRVRTYKAVPLGPKAGVIEFVSNSKALIEVIRPYHQKLDKLKLETARSMMKDCQTSGISERIKVYNEITSQIGPVLCHYFTDNFISPDAWFQSRQIYTRGIATTSMVGHILGLGDRHCNNILLDEFTGEPIHIDLGVAFDQGKRLPIPETVPFRLTRDIVDGFGISGTRGSFGKVCEHSFRVLRSNKDRILSILDVLRWDPLYSWSISPIRKQKLQDENGAIGAHVPNEHGSEAGDALLTVLKKINADGLSVEATVLELIQEATSVENLAVIYCGWCPFF